MRPKKSSANVSPLKQRVQLLEEAEKDFIAMGYDRKQAFVKNTLLKTLDGSAERLAYFAELSYRRKALANDFSQATNQLAYHLVKDSVAAEHFFSALDRLRKMGIQVMRERYGVGSHYHQTYHAIQVAYDVMRELEENLGIANAAHERILHLMMLGLAGAAGAWHDVMQDHKVKTHNEVVSANEFCDQMLEIFDQKDPVITAFLDFRELIAEELVIDGTFLDYQKDERGRIHAKPVGMRIDAELIEKIDLPHDPFQMLMIAKRSIALVDASSAAAEHVLIDCLIFRSLPHDDQVALNQFFTSPELENVAMNSEAFLQFMGQSMRMLLEGANRPQGKDYEQYNQAILVNRPDCATQKELSFSYADVLKHFFQNSKVLEAEDKFSVHMSNGEIESMWQKQRECVHALKKYIDRLSADELEKIAKAIFVSIAHERGTYPAIQAIVQGHTLLKLYHNKKLTLRNLLEE